MLNKEQEKELLEQLSELEHEQWMSWAKSILAREDISQERRDRWEKHFMDYADLPEAVKEQDRPFARRSFELVKKYLENLAK